MKYIILCLVAFVLCFGVGFVLSKLIFKKRRKLIVAVSTIAFGLVLIIVVGLVYFAIHYSADERAENALKGSENVVVNKIDEGYFFDGKGTDSALIFYSGAKVECEAYAPLMLAIAEQGLDCFLVDMPFNFAIFGSNKADNIIDSYDYEHIILAGHSLGGVTASTYAIKNANKVDGIVLLASYSTKKIDDSMKVLSIYGENDCCLDKDAYESNKSNLPTTYKEVVIEGGNHSQVGDYGHQSGDGDATISAETQQQLTAQAIIDYFCK